MAGLAGIRQGLATNLEALLGIQVSAYLLANPTPPVLWVVPGGPADTVIEYDKTFGRGQDLWEFTVQAFVGLASDLGAQKKLDEMLEPAGVTSVKKALEADKTLAGLVMDLHVTGASGYTTYTLPNVQGPVLGCQWAVEVRASGI